MMLKLSPRFKRNISRIIPFAVIWVVTGWVFLLIETAAMGSLDPMLPTAIALNFQVVVFATTIVAFIGLAIGAMETIVLPGMFAKQSFVRKIVFKFILYLLVLLTMLTIGFPIAASIESGVSILDHEIWNRFGTFMLSITFVSTLVQMGFSLMLCLIYSAISENLGHSVLANFFTGKYHSPTEEERIFMFLDMKSSTTLAEQLGHIRYFELLKDYYNDLAHAIIDHEGEVYQYIGDEIVISWTMGRGLQNNNCVRCFFAMQDQLTARKTYYQRYYNHLPSFKAGLHYGLVTTGEIGALKKEIAFSGDILNVTARIQGLCNQFEVDLLLSDQLHQRLNLGQSIEVRQLGEVTLRGRAEKIELVTLNRHLIN